MGPLHRFAGPRNNDVNAFHPGVFGVLLERRWAEGITKVRHLFAEIRHRGYTGSFSHLARFLAPWRGGEPSLDAEMKSDGELWRRSRLRQCKYLNNIVEQDHRRITRLARPGLRQLPNGARTLSGFEAMAMIRKGQVRNINGYNIRGQAVFIANLSGSAA